MFAAFFSGLGWYGNDTQLYLNMAKGIIDGNPISFFPNGFPLLLACIMLIDESNVQIIVIILNIAMQIFTLLMIDKILARNTVEEKVRLWILLIITFYPHFVSNVRFIYTETPSLFLIVLGILLYTYQKYPASGFIGYLSYTFRPSLLLVLPFITIYDFFRKKKYPVVKTALGFIIGILLFISLEWSGIVAPQSNQDLNILVAISGMGSNLDFQLKSFTAHEKNHPYKTYFNFILNNPLEYVKQRFLSLWSLWGPIVPANNFGILSMILHGLRFPFFILAVCCFIFRKKIGYSEFILLISFPIISVTLIHFFTFSHGRHQFTAEPFAIILSVLFLDYLLKSRKGNQDD
ncbi:MAG TPA: hypothetical protein VLN45_09065 [Ignavibacteriaceae bacterium]|nr:hypothetical protein [Ignavibacteriaceae bacterium]